jgi:hypothetical protein
MADAKRLILHSLESRRIEALGFAGKAHGKVTRIEVRDRARATPAAINPAQVASTVLPSC